MKLNNAHPDDVADLKAIVSRHVEPEAAVNPNPSLSRHTLLYYMAYPGMWPSMQERIYQQADIAADWFHEHGFQLYENVMRLFTRFHDLRHNWCWWWIEPIDRHDFLFVARPQLLYYTVEWLSDRMRNEIDMSPRSWLYRHSIHTNTSNYNFAAQLCLRPDMDSLWYHAYWYHAYLSNDDLVIKQSAQLVEQLTRFTTGLLKSKAKITKTKPAPIGFKLKTSWRQGY